jgi:hypothetical protein
MLRSATLALLSLGVMDVAMARKRRVKNKPKNINIRKKGSPCELPFLL